MIAAIGLVVGIVLGVCCSRTCRCGCSPTCRSRSSPRSTRVFGAARALLDGVLRRPRLRRVVPVQRRRRRAARVPRRPARRRCAALDRRRRRPRDAHLRQRGRDPSPAVQGLTMHDDETPGARHRRPRPRRRAAAAGCGSRPPAAARALAPRATGSRDRGAVRALLGFALVAAARRHGDRRAARHRPRGRARAGARRPRPSGRRGSRPSSARSRPRATGSCRAARSSGSPRPRARADALGDPRRHGRRDRAGHRGDDHDRDGVIDSAVLLDAVQELRDAGAEAIQIDDVRVVASTWFDDVPSGVGVVGRRARSLASPYRCWRSATSATLATALEIPGGVVDTVRTAGGRIDDHPGDAGRRDRVAAASTPQYARPAPSPRERRDPAAGRRPHGRP